MRSFVSGAVRTGLGLLPTPLSVRIHYFLHHKRFPKVRNPSRFSERIITRKLQVRDRRYPALADKSSVKEYVRQKIGADYVTPTLWCGSRLPPLELRDWPIPFVIKSSHGSGDNIFVRSQSDLDWPQIEARTDAWLSKRHAEWAGEWLYGMIQPSLLVEPFIGNVDALPIDYKFFVFGGIAYCIEVDTDRKTNHKRTFFDKKWRRQDFSLGYPIDIRPISKPSCLSQMTELAEELGRDFDFVRVDFYEIDGKPRFGEFTFYPDSGVAKFKPDRYDAVLGGLWSKPATDI